MFMFMCRQHYVVRYRISSALYRGLALGALLFVRRRGTYATMGTRTVSVARERGRRANVRALCSACVQSRSPEIRVTRRCLPTRILARTDEISSRALFHN
ncbi:hypothetical protein J6590_066972 [Homalodisca vitripennis]|nr:hypothetical protein J6590_066972 [Homalodisca vitripennis]